jgi:hydrogenase maturation protease
LNTRRLVVVDSILTGKAPVGTTYVFREDELKIAGGTSPHYVGLYESILLGRTLGLQVADEVVIVGVEIADCSTFDGTLHPAVRAAIPEVVQIVGNIISDSSTASLSAPAVASVIT